MLERALKAYRSFPNRVQSEVFVASAYYQRWGFQCIPLMEFQKRPIPGLKLHEIYEGKIAPKVPETHTGNLGVLAGSKSKIIVVDCDSEEAFELFKNSPFFKETKMVKTRKGYHLYYRIDDGFQPESRLFSNLKIDILGERRFAVAPPSVVRYEENGETKEFRYVWLNEETEFAKITEDEFKKMIEFLEKKAKPQAKQQEESQPEKESQPKDQPKDLKTEKTEQKKEEKTVLEVPEKGENFLLEDEQKEELKGKILEIFTLRKLKNIISFFKEICQIASKYYKEGIRQNIILALSGIARKGELDIPYEICEKIILETVVIPNKDKDIQQRISAIKNTYSLSKSHYELVGISLLRDLWFTEEELELIAEAKKEAKKNKDKEITDFLPGELCKKYLDFENIEELCRQMEKVALVFVCKRKYFKVYTDGAYYYLNTTLVCPYFEIEKVSFGQEKESYYLRTQRDTLHFIPEFDKRFFEKIGIRAYHDREFKILLDILVKNARNVFCEFRTGWLNEEKTIFLHPAIPHPEIEVDIKAQNVTNKNFFPKNPELKPVIHEKVRNLLTEGKYLGAKIVFALASLFGSFCVFDVAPQGTGKTTSSLFVVNLFYSTPDTFLFHHTETGNEQTLVRLTNLPVVFDEKLKKHEEKFHDLIFQIFGQRGKARSNPKLEVHVSKIQNVVFLTGEKLPPFYSQGVYRRFIEITAKKWEDYTELLSLKELHTIIKYECPIADDWIKFYLNNKNDIDLEFAQQENPFSEATYLGNIPNAVHKSLFLLEKFYQQKFEKLTSCLKSLLNRQQKDASIDPFVIFTEKFKNYIVQYEARFYKDPKDDERITTEVLGKLEDNIVYIFTNVFHNFCNQNELDSKYILERAQKEGCLITRNDGKLRIAKTIKGKTTSCYAFDLKKLEKFLPEADKEEDLLPF